LEQKLDKERECPMECPEVECPVCPMPDCPVIDCPAIACPIPEPCLCACPIVDCPTQKPCDSAPACPPCPASMPGRPKAPELEEIEAADEMCANKGDWQYGCGCGPNDEACAERNCENPYPQFRRRLRGFLPPDVETYNTPYKNTWMYDDLSKDCLKSKRWREQNNSSRVYKFEEFPCADCSGKNTCELSCAKYECPLDRYRTMQRQQGYDVAQKWMNDMANQQKTCGANAVLEDRPEDIMCDASGCTDERCCKGAGCIGECGCMMGRPYTHDEGMLASALVDGRSEWTSHDDDAKWDMHTVPTHLREEVGQLWANGGLAEHASVASFNRQVIALMVNGAPAKLLKDAMQGAQDEVDHAKRSFAIASQLFGREVGPGAFPEHENAHRTNSTELALDTLVEGGIGETFAATRAGFKANVVKHPGLKANYEQIRDDEARHAATAWQTISWIVAKEPAVAAKLQALYEQKVGAIGNGKREALSEINSERAQYGLFSDDELVKVQQAAKPLIDSIATRAFSGKLDMNDAGLGEAIASYW